MQTLIRTSSKPVKAWLQNAIVFGLMDCAFRFSALAQVGVPFTPPLPPENSSDPIVDDLNSDTSHQDNESSVKGKDTLFNSEVDPTQVLNLPLLSRQPTKSLGKDNQEPSTATSEKIDGEALVESAKARDQNKAVSEKLFYDARIIGFDRKNNTALFEGEVIVIGGGTIISADVMTLNQNEGTVNATGHVIVVSSSELFTGDELKYFLETGDLKITRAVLVAYDSERIEKVTNEILGFSPKETYFEAERAARLAYISKEKNRIFEEYSENAVFGVPPPENYVTQYATLLEQEELAQKIPNSALAKLTPNRRESFLKRRTFWQQNRQPISTSKLMTSYFRIEGAHLQRTGGNDFRALEAEWTPCFCEDDESPTWAFHAQRIEAQSGGYVDFEDAIFEIKGIPVLYLPKLKIPLKGQRQSGFLPPTLRTGDSRKGTVFTQPVFFDFAPNLDATLTTDYFQEKGTRLGLETRYKIRKNSGFRLNLESIRDRSWLEERKTRENLISWYRDPENGPFTFCPVDANLETCLQNQVDRPLASPPNTWRGSQEFEGNIFLTPRVSVATKGELRSDHRYVEDLELSDQMMQAFTPTLFANSYNTVKARASYDGSDVYAGIMGAFGDNVLIPDERFTGMQIPGRIDVVSRYYNLDVAEVLPVPLYGNVEYVMIPIQERNANSQRLQEVATLGSGQWQRYAMNFGSPLKTDGIYTIDYFADTEIRKIRHSGPGDTTNQIFSRKHGLSFRLPMDGLGVIPNFLRVFEDNIENDGGRYIHHFANWIVTLSQRPVVMRRGDYGSYGNNLDFPDSETNGARLIYMQSDRKFGLDSSSVPEEVMQTHTMVKLSTQHLWKTFRKNWSTQVGSSSADQSETYEGVSTYAERARQELMYSQDRIVANPNEMFTESYLLPADKTKQPGQNPSNPQLNGAALAEDAGDSSQKKAYSIYDGQQSPIGVDWHVNRYRLIDQDAHTPIEFNAEISYDWEREQDRLRQIERNRAFEAAEGKESTNIVPYHLLPRPWLGPQAVLGLNWGGYSLNTSVRYDLYLRTSESLAFGVGIPEFWESSVALSYSMSKTAHLSQNADGTKDLLFVKTRNTTAWFQTALIPKIHPQALIQKTSVDGQPKDTYETALGFSYAGSSGCWSMEFLRKKLHNQNEEDASYIVNLNVVFLGVSRGQNIAAGFTKLASGS